jgi:hypothetical protein
MSRTDKTRPWQIKHDEARAADPYRARHQGWLWSIGELVGCPDSCWMCTGWRHEENRRTRREGKQAARNWRKEYE